WGNTQNVIAEDCHCQESIAAVAPCQPEQLIKECHPSLHRKVIQVAAILLLRHWVAPSSEELIDACVAEACEICLIHQCIADIEETKRPPPPFLPVPRPPPFLSPFIPPLAPPPPPPQCVPCRG